MALSQLTQTLNKGLIGDDFNGSDFYSTPFGGGPIKPQVCATIHGITLVSVCVDRSPFLISFGEISGVELKSNNALGVFIKVSETSVAENVTGVVEKSWLEIYCSVFPAAE